MPRKRIPKTYIYSRASTSRQDTINQTSVLRNLYPDAEIVREKTSAFRGNLPELDSLLAKLKKGDTLVIYSIDRLGRRVRKLSALFEWFIERGVILISKREGIDLSTPSGRLVANIFASIAQVESEIRSDRVKAAIRRLKSEGRKFGGKNKGKTPCLQRIRDTPHGKRKDLIEGFAAQVVALRKSGDSIRKIADVMSQRVETKVSVSTVHRYVKIWEREGRIPVIKAENIPLDKDEPKKYDPDKPRMGDCPSRKKSKRLERERMEDLLKSKPFKAGVVDNVFETLPEVEAAETGKKGLFSRE